MPDSDSVLMLVPFAEHPAPAILRGFAHELSLRDELDPDWAVRPLHLERDHERTVLVLEDPGGDPLATILGPPLDVARFLPIAIGAAASVGSVHESGLIHKDIKPANILVGCRDGRIRLTGFGIASRLRRERQAPLAPDTIAGTLPYMAPEQTGRMNRSIDARTDLYALGVTFYEMITGVLPFTAEDPMGWVHCHIARQPSAPTQHAAGVPAQLCAIIMKLLAKNAEDRYQTAAGLQADLRRCLTAWEAHGSIEPFPLAAEDASNRLIIPEKLYGRQTEIQMLLAAFDEVVARGTTELVLVSGYSGIGKSSVVQELHKALVPPRGLFAAGKFDQYKRNIPYATVAQAFQSLVRQVLGKSDAELAHWRQSLLQALGQNGQLIINLVPELALIIGQQPPVPDLPARDAQNRFKQVFRHFLGAFARPEHPLALFLDDLQWLDAATLDLLEDLVTQPDVQHLLLVGAYRDNEVGASHPLRRTLDEIRRGGARVHDIVLAPLGLDELVELVADAMKSDDRVRPLAELLHSKTAGNPFFAIQFLTTLADEGLLAFDQATRSWHWDIDRIRAKGYTENVVDLMAGKLNRLPTDTQEALKLLACLGNAAPIARLVTMDGDPREGDPADAIHARLWEAVQAGLVLRLERAYAFPHDRIQQAAYSLMPEVDRAGVHLRIGRAMLESMADSDADEQLFDIADQLNRGAALLVDSEERARAAEINLGAGRKAKASAAYEAACLYLAAGMALLPQSEWERHYALMFSLWLERAECEYLRGDLGEAERFVGVLLERGQSKVDLAAAYNLTILLHVVQSENNEAVASALSCLRLFGIDLPAHPSWDEVQAEYQEVWRNLDERSIEELVDLPLMTDPELLAAMRVLSVLCDPAYVTDEKLLCLELCRAVNLGIRHGVSGAFAHACCYLAWPLATIHRRYPEGYSLAKVGYDLVEKHDFSPYRPKVQDATGIAAFWTQPIATSIDYVRDSFRSALETGDLTYACYAIYHTVTLLLLRNEPLDLVSREAEMAREFVRNAKFRDMEDTIVPQQQFIATMQGRTANLSTFNDGQFDEDTFEAQLIGGRMPTMICWYWTMKAKARFLAGAYDEALVAIDKADELLWSSTGHFPLIDFYYYAALTVAALQDSGADLKGARRDQLMKWRDQLREWADINRLSFGDKHALVSAEIARIEGDDLLAMRLYEEAVALAAEHGFVQNEALAYERAARFYGARGYQTFAQAYLRNARFCYGRWGAAGKVRQLEAESLSLRTEEHPSSATSTIAAPLEHLELATVIKVSQAISSEIVLEKLLETLMRIAIEHAGAERALLILLRDDGHQIEAEASTGGGSLDIGLPQRTVTSTDLPASVLHYAIRTQATVLLGGAATESPFSEDPYIRDHHARSILCLPLLKQSKLTGVLYLENNLTEQAFTPGRIAVLKLLASQAAISLENTRLYRSLEEREAKIRRLVESDIIGIFIWDSDGRIIDANDAFLEMVQYSRDELSPGLRWLDMTPPEWQERVPAELDELKSTGAMQSREKEFFRKDGTRVPVMIGAAAFDGQPNQGVAYVLDITKRKRAEEAARDSEHRYREVQRELARANRLATMGQLTGSIAHEVNQPIAATIIGAQAGLRWLRHEPPVLDEVRDALVRIISDGTRAGEVIGRIRSMIQKTTPKRDLVAVNAPILDVIELLRTEINKKSVTIRIDLGSDSPGVWGDRIQIQQVMLNLIVNALEALGGPNDAKRELMVSTRETDSGDVLVSVGDSGPGLTAPDCEQIFDPFYTTKATGLGLGLSICRSIVEDHGGRMWASANAPCGALLQFTLPRAEDAALPSARDDGP